MIEFIAGILIGAFVGVLADRLWQAYECRTRIGVTTGFSHSLDRGQRLCVTITNYGVLSLPPFKVEIFNPRFGTVEMFQSDDTGPLGPDESRKFYCAITPDTTNTAFLQTVMPAADEAARKRAQFRLTLAKGSKVIYENNRIGVALLEMVNQMVATHSFSITGELAARGCTHPKTFWQWVGGHVTVARAMMAGKAKRI